MKDSFQKCIIRILKVYKTKCPVILHPFAYLAVLLTVGQLAIAQLADNSSEYYNMANDIYSLHTKSTTSTVLINPSTDNSNIKANTSTSAAEKESHSTSTSADNLSKSQTQEINTTDNTINTNSNNLLINPRIENHLVDGGNSEQKQFDNSALQEDKSLSAKLPSYKKVKAVADKYLKELEATSTKFNPWKKSKSADSNLPSYNSKVSYLKTQENFLLDDNNEQLKNVPKINIGLENKINGKNYLTQQINGLAIEYKTPAPLDTPNKISRTELIKAKNAINAVNKTKRLKGKSWELGPVVKLNELNNLKYQSATNKSFRLNDVEPLSKYDVFMLSALIFKQKRMYSLALGLFDEISQSEKHKLEANYNMGEIAHNLKLYSEAAHRLLPIVLESNEYRADAITILTKDFPKEHDRDIALALSNMKDKETLPPLFMDKIFYFTAKAQFDTKKFKSASYSAIQVGKNSEFYENAQFIKGLSEYLANDLTNSVQTLVGLQASLTKKSKEEKNISSLVALNLGRVFFQLKKYKQAYHSYKRIHKSHPLWVQAVTELGWVQLAMGDQFGAIGNMYSMHSPYFNAVYKPETYAIKTIGYLNICQYADAYKSMSLHEKSYREWDALLSNYMTAGASPNRVYKTVIKYLSGKSTANVDGLPYQLTREIARQKGFLNIQNDINSKIDESRSYNKALIALNTNNKKASKKLKKYKGQLKKVTEKINVAKNQNDDELLKQAKTDLESVKEYITAYYFQLRLFDHGKKKLNQLKQKTQARIKKENATLVAKAGKSLLNNLKKIRTGNKNLLDNNELLRYEIFAGSGENIRFQVSGGKVKNENRIPSSVRPKKSLDWDFSGEYWEDEIGNYRTTLVDKCPK